MFWVTVWFAYRYENGKEIRPSRSRPLEDWIHSRFLTQHKLAFLLLRDRHPTLPFETIDIEWIWLLASFLYNGFKSGYDYQHDLAAYNKKRGSPHQGLPPNEPFSGMINCSMMIQLCGQLSGGFSDPAIPVILRTRVRARSSAPASSTYRMS
ncbi:hypothetical protein BS47DRAFT_844265 [Hydnum rufescens UP504]|uniref:Uncharacterized protein n=1 Tax=Hydnum rufescens UP504 TaxID=1448309 RepID=A0A9P6ACU4_9AGAM|nr:hypothetical protein BS47DRAFT_844265 [Hydnum rufescens UP504]